VVIETASAKSAEPTYGGSSEQTRHKTQPIGDDSLAQKWLQCLAEISKHVNNQSFKTWFEPLVPIKFEKNELTIQVPSQFFYEWLEEHYYAVLRTSIEEIFGQDIKLIYAVAEEEYLAPSPVEPQQVPLEGAVLPEGHPQRQNHIRASVRREDVEQMVREANLNTRYTFENFIKGESNQYARAAALAVANNPGGTSFNPLVLYGGVGLGKTHLIQAIGNHALRTGRARRVYYVSSEKFTVDFVDAIQRDRLSEFSNRYRSMDILIVDDIQFFSGKEKTQDNFFHTFNELHQLGKQIVLSSDKPPKELKGLDERLISRFQWGLTADIQPPDLETRIAILRKKSEDNGVDLPQDIVEFIAVNVTTNIRELEGCLISLLARSSLENKPITIELAREVVQTIVTDVRPPIGIEFIQRTVANYYDIPEDLLRAKTRKQEVALARQVAMYLAKELTSASLKTIGLHFGGRDHSTVIHAYQTIEDLMKNDETFRNALLQLRRKIELTSR